MKLIYYSTHLRLLPALLVLMLCIPFKSYGQEKKPTIMILPSDNWCNLRFYTMKFNDQGKTVSISDYQRAFKEDTELGPVISQLGQILTDYGYSIKDSEQELKNISTRSVEEENIYSKSGSALAESPLDILKRSSKADIIIQLGWIVNNEYKGKSVSFTIEAFDSYTSKRIATATGISNASDDILPRQFSSAIKKYVKTFDSQLTKHFSELKSRGREIVLTITRWDSWDGDLETEYAGEELLDIIQTWLTDNTVGGNFNLSDATENLAKFEQVRIPFFNDKGIAMDSRAFATKLRKFLQAAPYNITSKVMTRGLGEAIIVLGEK